MDASDLMDHMKINMELRKFVREYPDQSKLNALATEYSGFSTTIQKDGSIVDTKTWSSGQLLDFVEHVVATDGL